jgi:hypothetical protein
MNDYTGISLKDVSSSRAAPLRDVSARVALLHDVSECAPCDFSKPVSCDFPGSAPRGEMPTRVSLSKATVACVFLKSGRQKIKVEFGVASHTRKRVRFSSQCRESLRIPAGSPHQLDNWEGGRAQRLPPAPRDWAGRGIVIRKKKHAPRTKLKVRRGNYWKRACVQKLSQHIQSERQSCKRCRYADETPEQHKQRLVGVDTYIKYLRRAPKRFRV